MSMYLYTEKTPGLPGFGAFCNAPVPVDAEIWEDRNLPMSRKASLLRRLGKLVKFLSNGIFNYTKK